MVAKSSFDVRADEVAVICRDVGVKRLELVGRAAEGIDFDPKVNLIHFHVEFLPGSERPLMGEYGELMERLAELYGRCVGDVLLIADEETWSPEYRDWINATRTLVYAD